MGLINITVRKSARKRAKISYLQGQNSFVRGFIL